MTDLIKEQKEDALRGISDDRSTVVSKTNHTPTPWFTDGPTVHVSDGHRMDAGCFEDALLEEVKRLRQCVDVASGGCSLPNSRTCKLISQAEKPL